MFSPKTLVKYGKLAKERTAYYKKQTPNMLKVSITDGNEKIGKVLNVSLLPIVTCARCSECKTICYDIKACIFRSAVINARAKNTVLALYNPEKYFSDIRKKLKNRRKNFSFRWHVGGDIPNYTYFCEMIKIATEFPHFKFWTYTKNYEIVNRFVKENGGDRKAAIPSNFSIMFSEWRGMAMINPYNFPEFRVVFNDDKVKPSPKKNHYCPGSCDICLKNNRGCPYGETTYCKEH